MCSNSCLTGCVFKYFCITSYCCRTTATDLSADTTNSNDEDDDEIKNYKVAVGVLSAFLIISAVAAIVAFVMLQQKKKTSEPMANL
jgi:hypothetical protein